MYIFLQYRNKKSLLCAREILIYFTVKFLRPNKILILHVRCVMWCSAVDLVLSLCLQLQYCSEFLEMSKKKVYTLLNISSKITKFIDGPNLINLAFLRLVRYLKKLILGELSNILKEYLPDSQTIPFNILVHLVFYRSCTGISISVLICTMSHYHWNCLIDNADS